VSGFSREGHELIRRVATNVLQLAPALADSMALLLHEQLPDLGAVTDQRAISETRRSCAENIRELLIMFRAGIPARTVSELKRFATAAAPALPGPRRRRRNQPSSGSYPRLTPDPRTVGSRQSPPGVAMGSHANRLRPPLLCDDKRSNRWWAPTIPARKSWHGSTLVEAPAGHTVAA
jgi:hypothetical protein